MRVRAVRALKFHIHFSAFAVVPGSYVFPSVISTNKQCILCRVNARCVEELTHACRYFYERIFCGKQEKELGKCFLLAPSHVYSITLNASQTQIQM